MRWLVFALSLLVAAPAMAQTAAGPATAMTPTPDDRARQWLILVDDANYADAYTQLDSAARDKITADAWGQKLRGARAPLGAMASRALKDVKLAKTMPGMPDGQYAIVRYDTSFAHKASAVETVVLRSQAGAWSTIGYFIS
jgi:hypothetical protein